MKLKSEYKRIIVLLLATIFLELWVMVNANSWFAGALTYILIGIIGIALYTMWDKI